MPIRTTLPETPDYTGIPQNESKLIVHKSNPLKTLSETGMTLPELKILDAYLSRINSNEPDKRFVRLEKGELEKLLGVTKLNQSDLNSRLDALGKFVTIRDKNKEEGITKIALFEKAHAVQGEDGLWQVDLMCTPSAMEYIFNIEKLGYIRYMLKNVTELQSRYSYVLYIYLENRRQSPKLPKTWKIGIEELKKMLKCDSKSYESFKYFNDLVLKKCHKEINEKTNLHYSFQPIDKKGKKYVNIQFTIDSYDAFIINENEENQEIERLEGQASFFDEQAAALATESKDKASEYTTERLRSFGQDILNNEFSPEEVQVIADYMEELVPNHDELQEFKKLTSLYHLFKAQEAKKEIPNKFGYFCTMLKNEVEYSKNKKEEKKSEFDASKYDFLINNF